MTRRRRATDEVVVEVRVMGPGTGFSGVVLDCDAGSGLAVGDEVFGTLCPGDDRGPFVACRRQALAHKPASLAHAEAAVLAGAGPVALAATRLSGARPRDRVMITGAGSDAGAIAVQVAKVMGAHVTAVCSDRDVPLVWDLGADQVRARERGAGDSERFAAVIDTDQSITPVTAGQLLEPDGRLIALRDRDIHVSTARGVSVAVLSRSASDQIDLIELTDLVERSGVFPLPR